MHKALITVALAGAFGLAGCGDKDSKTADAGTCPSQQGVEAAITDHVQKTVWSAGERDIWKVNAIDGFTFSPIQTGDIVKKQVEYGVEGRDVCPVRVTYSYKVHHNDGTVTTTEMGANSTHLFYPNAFHEWTFKTE